MATVDDWNKYINLLHELALVEDELRRRASFVSNYDYEEAARTYAVDVLWEFFGVDTPEPTR